MRPSASSADARNGEFGVVAAMAAISSAAPPAETGVRAGERCANDELEAGNTLVAVGLPDPAKEAARLVARSFGISSIESDQPGNQRVEPVGCRAGQHAVSFCKASLAATELREPYECVGVPAGTEPAATRGHTR